MENKYIIGKNIKFFREKLRISQEALGDFLGVSHTSIGKYEDGKISLSTDMIQRISNLFGIDEYDLYSEDMEQQVTSIAFAFKADYLTSEDLGKIAEFQKIVRNYLKMKKAKLHE